MRLISALHASMTLCSLPSTLATRLWAGFQDTQHVSQYFFFSSSPHNLMPSLDFYTEGAGPAAQLLRSNVQAVAFSLSYFFLTAYSLEFHQLHVS